jgi:hypothetical protein
MKTLLNSLRNSILTSSLIMIYSLVFAQQESTVWLTINDLKNVPTVDASGKLIADDMSFNEAIASLNITGVKQALSSSRNPSLLKVYEVTCDCEVEDLYASLTNTVSVVSKVEYGPDYETLATPNDYGLNAAHYALDLIGAENAWNITTGDENIVIAVSDQNFEITHEELVSQYIYYDATNTQSTGHGTSVAILAAGETDNSHFNSSIGYKSSLALYRMNPNEILDASYAGADVINISWASGCEYNSYFQDLIDEAYENGSFIVAAAGNGSTCGGPESLVYPAAYNHVFAVTSIGQNFNHQSVLGDVNSTHQHNETVDLSAPGYNVLISPSQGWETVGSGTSYASPMVAGTVALMKAANSCLRNDDIAYILKASSTNIDAFNPDYIGLIGEGCLNAGAALEMAQDYNQMTFDFTESLSCGSYGGSIEVEINGGNEPYTAEWSNGGNGLLVTDLASGEYSVMVSDAMGCSKEATVVLGTASPTVFEGEVEYISCHGSADGSIDLTIIEGQSDFTYEWDAGMDTEDLYNLIPGTYRVTITDGNGCEVYGSFDVKQPEALEATLITSPLTDDVNGEIDVTVTGGTAPYSYLWNTGDNSEDLYDLLAGDYEVLVTDDNGCNIVLNGTIENLSSAATNFLNDMNVQVYPNPTSDFASVRWDNNDISEISIVNTNGQIIQRADVSMQNSFQTKNLNTGVYLIHLKGSNNITYTGKLIAQ